MKIWCSIEIFSSFDKNPEDGLINWKLNPKPELQKPFKCYGWTTKDIKQIHIGGWSIKNEKRTCEGYESFVFTQGDESKAPGCGTCWCCQPNEGKTRYVNKNYSSTKKDPNNLKLANYISKINLIYRLQLTD